MNQQMFCDFHFQSEHNWLGNGYNEPATTQQIHKLEHVIRTNTAILSCTMKSSRFDHNKRVNFYSFLFVEVFPANDKSWDRRMDVLRYIRVLEITPFSPFKRVMTK